MSSKEYKFGDVNFCFTIKLAIFLQINSLELLLPQEPRQDSYLRLRS